MFQKTLGLSNNPFDPDDFPAMPNLSGEPLRVDEEPKLLDLFCWDVGDLLQSKLSIDRFLFGLLPAGAQSPPKPGIIVIAGGKGTGKTTLGSYIKHRLLQSAAPVGGWKDFRADFPSVDDPTRPTAFVDRMKVLRDKLSGSLGAMRENVFVFFDDFPPNSFGAVTNLYQDFKSHNQVYVVTTTDIGLKQNELNWSVAARVKLILTRNINASELQAYMMERVSRYRDPIRGEFDKLTKTFPWAMSAAQRLVGANPNADQPLRLLNRWLSEEVALTHTDRAADPAIDVATLPEKALAKLLIP
jgi:hypothetical protein